jgi:hypothetical protein
MASPGAKPARKAGALMRNRLVTSLPYCTGWIGRDGGGERGLENPAHAPIFEQRPTMWMPAYENVQCTATSAAQG